MFRNWSFTFFISISRKQWIKAYSCPFPLDITKLIVPDGAWNEFVAYTISWDEKFFERRSVTLSVPKYFFWIFLFFLLFVRNTLPWLTVTFGTLTPRPLVRALVNGTYYKLWKKTQQPLQQKRHTQNDIAMWLVTWTTFLTTVCDSRVCAHRAGLIRKYNLNICRQCFR